MSYGFYYIEQNGAFFCFEMFLYRVDWPQLAIKDPQVNCSLLPAEGWGGELEMQG